MSRRGLSHPSTPSRLLATVVLIGGSAIGSPEDTRQMLQLAVDKQINPWIQERPMKDANRVIVEMDQGKARYRYTLANEGNPKE